MKHHCWTVGVPLQNEKASFGTVFPLCQADLPDSEVGSVRRNDKEAGLLRHFRAPCVFTVGANAPLNICIDCSVKSYKQYSKK